MLEISKASETEYSEARDFYYTLIDMMQNLQYKPGWQKGVYPTEEYLLTSIRNQQLYVGRSEEKIAAAMIVNHDCNDGYSQANWKISAEKNEISVIHALGVLPTYSGKGFAKKMIRKAVSTAKQNCQKAIRLDILCGNLPAEKLYTGMGFEYIKTVQMYYEDTGWTDFLLYELPL